MKIPLNPPAFDILFEDEQLLRGLIVQEEIGPTRANGDYIHWDLLRHLTPPEGLNHKGWWFAMKLARKKQYKKLPFKDKHGNAFVLATPDSILQKLHNIDRNVGNTISNPQAILTTNMRDTYLFQSLVAEAITSSQLEGASTTRKVAKDMLRTGRKPHDLSEKMIFNNYQAMEFVREIKNEKLTLEMILELHRLLTEGTLEDQNYAGCLRRTDDIHVWDNADHILHTPPKAKELEQRLHNLCEFANSGFVSNSIFIHPVVKAIILHFMLAYDHPFIDGNGRTARALFYWCMANQGYLLMEFISISESLKRSPIKYAKAFLYTETDESDLTYFVAHQMGIILEAIDTLFKYLKKESKEISETEELLYSNPILKDKLNYRQIALIKHALKHPNMGYKIEAHRKSHNVEYDTARNDLLKLANLNLLLREKSGKSFIFRAPLDLKKRISTFRKSGRDRRQ